MPGLNTIESHYKHLKCVFYSSWSCYDIYGNYTNNSTSNATLSLQMGSGNQLNSGHVPSSSSLSSSLSLFPDGASKTVLYTFGHHGREGVLADTLLNFDTNYALAFNTSFIVFYNKDSPLDVTFMNTRLKSFPSSTSKSNLHILDRIKFVPIKLKVLSTAITNTLDYDCNSDNPEIIGSSHFLRFEVFDILHSYGYSWFWRFSEDSSLKNKIDYNVFQSLANTNKLYGYVLIYREHKKCSDFVWYSVTQLCKSQHSADFKCSEWLEKWPSYVVFFNNFEISHISLWQSESVKRIRKLVSTSDSTDSGNSFIRRHHDRLRIHGRSRRTSNSTSLKSLPYTNSNGLEVISDNQGVFNFDYSSDAAIHALCVLTTLQPENAVRLDQIDYSTRLPPKSFTRLNQNSVNKSSEPSSNPKHIVADNREYYKASIRGDLDKRFQIQRFGWMGGDVAASFYLPLADESKKIDTEKKYIWLFGDTYVGTSTITK